MEDRGKISLRDEIAATEEKENTPSLRDPWQAKKWRSQTAGILAIGLLVLFALTVLCNGLILTAFAVTTAVKGNFENPGEGVTQIMDFTTTILPYIATPLGIALGFYFKESKSE